jgi:SAM-dependent methyltransferase
MKAAEIERMYAVEATHWWYRGMREIQGAILRSLNGAPTEAAILDAGCGAGFNLMELGARGVGVDVSEVALEFCRARGAEKVFRADIAALPFPDAAFDRVQSFDVLSDRGVSDDQRAVRELARVLRSGGIVVVGVPALLFLRRSQDEAVDTTRRYSRRALTDLLETAGLTVERVTYCNSFLFPLVVLKSLADRTLGRILTEIAPRTSNRCRAGSSARSGGACRRKRACFGTAIFRSAAA